MSSPDLMELHNQLHVAIDAIDEQLDSQTDSQAAGKRKITSELISDNEASWKPVVEQLVSQLTTAQVEVQIGFYYGLIRELGKVFGTPLSAKLDELVEAQPKIEVEVIPPEQLEVLTKTRSELYAKIKSLLEMAKNFGMDEGMKMPRKRTGKKGKRGPRQISFFSWEIDGTDYENLKAVQEAYSVDYEKVSALTKAMRDAKLNLTEPGDRLEFTLPDGKVLIGTRDDEKVVNENEDTGEEDDDEDGEEVVA